MLYKNYKFTTKISNFVCRICGAKFDRSWSSGGCGAICKDCFIKRDIIDLVELKIIRNITKVPKDNPYGFTFKFEAKIDGNWYNCHTPCGDFSSVENFQPCHAVPVGFWELKELYFKHGGR